MVEHIIWVLSELSVAVRKLLNRVGRTCISLFTVEHFSFHAFHKKCVLQRDLMSCSSRLTLQRGEIFFLHIFVFWKNCKSFSCCWASRIQPQQDQILHWYPLTSSKHIWPKISIAYFTKWFQSIFTVGEWRMYPFNLPLLAPAYIPTQSCERALFGRLNPARARTRLESDVYFWSPI